MRKSLNYSWNYVPSYQDEFLNKISEDAVKVNIPHTVKEVNYNYFNELDYQFISTYEKYFDVDNFNKNRRYFIRFDGFMVKAKIYLNNNYLGEYVSIYIPIEIEISSFIKEKDNRLLVILDSKEDKNYPPFGFALDYLTFGGIYREVYLIDEPSSYLRDIYVHASINGDMNIIYNKIGNDNIDIIHHLYFKDELITTFKEDKYHLDNPKLWDLSSPNLYKLHTEIIVNNIKETYITTFGFKEAVFKKDGFYLNNQKIKLIGLNRHQGYPYMGYAASKSLQEEDALLLKYEVGVNVVRTSHYPQSEHFLNKCDKIGLLVINEIPGWQHLGENESWINQCLINTEKMVLKERNHVSLIAHGVRIDESIDNHDLYIKTNDIAHKLDPYRPTIGVRNFTTSELLEDIYGYNDFICDSLKVGLTKPSRVKHKNKPLLVTEYMGHMDPLKGTSDSQKKIEVALRHAKVIDDNLKYKDLTGAIGWCFIDYQTHADFGSGDYICPHGVYDLYRNPKYSSYIYASQNDNKPVMFLMNNMKPGDVPAAIFNDIYIATNCDYVELYKNDEYVSRFYPNNKLFKYLKHPPILIDDIVGETFKEDKFPYKSQRKIAKMFSYAAMHGFNHLPLKMRIYLGLMMFKYHMNYSELVHYWNKYVGAWGGKARTYHFKGYINNELVKEIKIGPFKEYDLEVATSRDTLINEDTYDTLPIRIRHIDKNNNLLEYSSRVIDIEVSGPINLIGPTHQALLGGQLTIYVTSKLEVGQGKVIIKMDDIVKEINVSVK